MDIPAPGVGAVCGACPLGYTGDAQKCYGQFISKFLIFTFLSYIDQYEVSFVGPLPTFPLLHAEK